MKRIMLDFETLGVNSNACIVQIGACYFDLDGNVGETFKCRVSAEDAVKHGAIMDPQTVNWWLTQSDAARKSITEGDAKTELSALTELNDFIKGASEIWSHATFDFVILSNALNRRGVQPTFKYSVARDIRTLTALVKVDVKKQKREGVHHDALDDCIYQVQYVTLLLRALKA